MLLLLYHHYAAVSACEKGGEWAHALDILGNMARSSIAMATITCNAAVSACEEGGEWTQALDVSSTMARSRFQMSTTTCKPCHAIIHAINHTIYHAMPITMPYFKKQSNTNETKSKNLVTYEVIGTSSTYQESSC